MPEPIGLGINQQSGRFCGLPGRKGEAEGSEKEDRKNRSNHGEKFYVVRFPFYVFLMPEENNAIF